MSLFRGLFQIDFVKLACITVHAFTRNTLRSAELFISAWCRWPDPKHMDESHLGEYYTCPKARQTRLFVHAVTLPRGYIYLVIFEEV